MLKLLGLKVTGVWLALVLACAYPSRVGAQCLSGSPPCCFGDCNGNGVVSAGDLTKVIAIILNCPNRDASGCAAAPGGCINADKPNALGMRDGRISAGELTLLISNIVKLPESGGCPPAATPTSGVPSSTPTTSPTVTPSPQSGPPGPVVLVSINSAGTASGNSGSSSPSISDDGRYVVFGSAASDLVANDTNGTQQDVFVRDLTTGTTTLVSVNSAGTASGNHSSGALNARTAAAISADGRYVAFSSLADDLTGLDTNGVRDVFVRDRTAGVTTLVSINSAGTASGNGSSSSPVISADGRYVAFFSSASNLVANDSNGTQDVFVRDLMTGTTTLVSVNAAGTDSGNAASNTTAITPDGHAVAFRSLASDLMANDTGTLFNVFVRNLTTGMTTLASVNATGGSGNHPSGALSDSGQLVISADGRYVAFESFATNLVPNADTNGRSDVFVRDLVAGTTTLVSINSAATGTGDNASKGPLAITPDGRYVAFESTATNLVETTGGGAFVDVFVRDLWAGTTSRASENLAGTAGGNGDSGDSAAGPAVLSADGRYATFASWASDLVAGDNNFGSDIFVRDRVAGTTTLVSSNSAVDSLSFEPAMSADGRYVVFGSDADNLVPNDANGAFDVFVRDMRPQN
jgi:Tol biopolymer transport system component